MTVYGKIENGKFIPAAYGDPETLLAQGYNGFEDDDVSKYYSGKVELSDGFNTASQLKSILKMNLQARLDELDKKRIRAMCEPELKDAVGGKTWLEYYTEEIISLRAQLGDL